MAMFHQNNEDSYADQMVKDVVLKKNTKESNPRISTSNIKVLSNRARMELLDQSPMMSSIKIGA